MDLTYKEFDPPSHPFKMGDVVVVVDREGVALSEQKIAKVLAKTVKTACGREWTKDRGWYVGDTRAWPFPTIRLREDVKNG